MDLPSGAVQDAQQMAKLAPFGMIFVPSRDGISHSPKEFTSWQDVANGAEVLYRSLVLVDRQPDRKYPDSARISNGSRFLPAPPVFSE
jgi:N-carbamoyl-L-amino-acid hydrolase